MRNEGNNKKVVGVIMTYNCSPGLERLYSSIPKHLFDEIICVDDESTDDSVEIAQKLGIQSFTHPHMGYGGNLLFGLGKAMEMGADYMIEIHGDGQYSLASAAPAIEKLSSGYDLVLGDRFYQMAAPLRDGMDLVRYFGNIFLSLVARFGLGLRARDFFAGFRAYSRQLFEAIDFSEGSKNYFFSFELIVQTHYRGFKIGWVPAHCDYKGYHTSMRLAKGFPAISHTIRTVILYRLARLNIKLGIFRS